jgi:spermidine synthase
MIKHWFSPQVIKEFPDSKYNKDIKLIKFSGALRLDMGNLTQSGQIIEWIWAKVFKKLLPTGQRPEDILILGFGTGSLARLINRKWPQAKITALEIDPVIIKIGKEYFETDKIKNLKIINANAIKYKLVSKYSIIIVDCYLGDQIPADFEDIKFLNKLKSHTDYLFLNRLYWEPYKTKTNIFLEKLKKHFQVATCSTPSNLIISLS